MLRKGKITPDDCEQQLDEINAELAGLRAQPEGLQAQADLASASEAYLTDVGVALARLRPELERIEAEDDRAEKRAYIEQLTTALWVETEIVDRTQQRIRKRARLVVRLALRPDSVTEYVSATPS